MKKETTLIFTGDIGFDRYMDGKWDDPDLISQEVLDYLHSADHVIANVEGPLVANRTNQAAEGTAQLMHTMNPAAARVLRNMHADIWNLCNNHIMDAGDEGVAATLNEAAESGAMTLGAGMDLEAAKTPLYLDEAGGVGMFSVGYRRGCKPAGERKAGCLLWNEMELIRQNIDAIKKEHHCRWCIIVAHGGEEFTSLPSPYTRDRYLKYLEMGADVVVCHHPHVPMNYEIVPAAEEDKVIFYSLGNFIFDTDYQRAQYNTEKGLLVKLHLTEETFSFEGFGIRIERGPEHIVKGELPEIFENVGAEDYALLAPLAARMFVAATKRQQIYLNPEKFRHATEEDWEEHFANPKRSGRVPGEALDFFIICPLAEEAGQGAWKQCRLERVKHYILQQM